ncbi:MAG TPA: hypothetical protein VJJ22_01680 [Candidatus Paceibacterota bacterium]
MTKYQKFALVALRLTMGSLFLYAGVSKIADSSWSAIGYINSAVNFSSFFQMLTSGSILPIINIVNEVGLTLLGVSLLTGTLVGLSAPLGALLMLLYYLVLPFPWPNAHALVVDEHIIYIFGLLVLAAFRSGEVSGLDAALFGKRSTNKKTITVTTGTYKPGP